VHLWGLIWKIFGLLSILERHRGESRESTGSIGDATAENHETVAAADQPDSGLEPIHLEVHRQVPALLQDPKEGVRMGFKVLRGLWAVEGVFDEPSSLESTSRR
jgi:hypothetical protein